MISTPSVKDLKSAGVTAVLTAGSIHGANYGVKKLNLDTTAKSGLATAASGVATASLEGNPYYLKSLGFGITSGLLVTFIQNVYQDYLKPDKLDSNVAKEFDDFVMLDGLGSVSIGSPNLGDVEDDGMPMAEIDDEDVVPAAPELPSAAPQSADAQTMSEGNSFLDKMR